MGKYTPWNFIRDLTFTGPSFQSRVSGTTSTSVKYGHPSFQSTRQASRIAHFNNTSSSSQPVSPLVQNCGCYIPSSTQPYSYDCNHSISPNGCPGISGPNTTPHFNSTTSTCWIYKISNFGQPNQTMLPYSPGNYLWPINTC